MSMKSKISWMSTAAVMLVAVTLCHGQEREITSIEEKARLIRKFRPRWKIGMRWTVERTWYAEPPNPARADRKEFLKRWRSWLCKGLEYMEVKKIENVRGDPCYAIDRSITADEPASRLFFRTDDLTFAGELDSYSFRWLAKERGSWFPGHERMVRPNGRSPCLEAHSLASDTWPYFGLDRKVLARLTWQPLAILWQHMYLSHVWINSVKTPALKIVLRYYDTELDKSRSKILKATPDEYEGWAALYFAEGYPWWVLCRLAARECGGPVPKEKAWKGYKRETVSRLVAVEGKPIHVSEHPPEPNSNQEKKESKAGQGNVNVKRTEPERRNPESGEAPKAPMERPTPDDAPHEKSPARPLLISAAVVLLLVLLGIYLIWQINRSKPKHTTEPPAEER